MSDMYYVIDSVSKNLKEKIEPDFREARINELKQREELLMSIQSSVERLITYALEEVKLLMECNDYLPPSDDVLHILLSLIIDVNNQIKRI